MHITLPHTMPKLNGAGGPKRPPRRRGTQSGVPRIQGAVPIDPRRLARDPGVPTGAARREGRCTVALDITHVPAARWGVKNVPACGGARIGVRCAVLRDITYIQARRWGHHVWPCARRPWLGRA
jgi:hypothetical protein